MGGVAVGSVSASAGMETKEVAIQTSQEKEGEIKPEATPFMATTAPAVAAAAYVGADAAKDVYDWGKDQLGDQTSPEKLKSGKLDVIFD